MIQLIEIIDLKESGLKHDFLKTANASTELAIATDVEDYTFGSIKIISDDNGNLIIRDQSGKDDIRELVIGPPKDRPPYPAGQKPKPPIVVRPRR